MPEQAAGSPRGTARIAVDETALRFRGRVDSVLDILFDGRRVWSIDPADLPPAEDGWTEVAWPPALQRQLDGHADIQVVEHVSSEVLGSLEARFGSAEGRVAVVDGAGHPAVLTKWGRLVQPFATTERSAIDAYLDQVESVLAILRDECGVPAFLSFGSLLGAVREGKVIAHDVDVDLGYLSAFDNPVDVLLEGLRIERVLASHGLRPKRHNGGFLAMDLRQPDGTTRNLDVFTAFLQEGRLHQVNDIDTEAVEGDVLPLATIVFEGRPMPVPARPEVFLESAYGKEWRVPNPAFSFDRPRRQRRRVRGWFGGMRERRDYWGRFYGSSRHRVPAEPSPFAHWVAERETGGRLVDLGCGTGRDTVFFARRGFTVVGVDAVPRHARAAAAKEDLPATPEFMAVNLESLRETLIAGADLASARVPTTVHARFLLHALTESARHNAWRLIAMSLSAGGKGYLEFRTPRDKGRPKHFGEHYRRFLRPRLAEEEARRYGLRVLHQETGQGLSPLGKEDPYLCRMVVERKSD